jgi:hypothetical protein
MDEFELMEPNLAVDEEFEPNAATDEKFGLVGLAPVRAATSKLPLWQIMRGPVGTGSCLARDEPDGGVLFIAPPGVALQRPERAAPLMGWRRARWQYGASQGGVVPCTLEEVEELAPANHAWIQERMREDERLDLMLAQAQSDQNEEQLAVSEPPVVVSVAAIMGTGARGTSAPALLPDRRPATIVTRSASTFSALTYRLPPSEALAKVEGLLRDAVSASHLATELDTLSLAIGPTAVRELVVALLHARTRSHSWRYTRWLGPVEHRGEHERQLVRLASSSHSALELLELLRADETGEHESHEILVDLLYAQHRSLRWRITYPLRRLLGSPRLQSWRRVLRHHVQPRVAAARSEGSSGMKTLPPAQPSG